VDPVRVERCGHDIDELLHKRADGRLSRDEASALERRTSACAECRERALLLSWAVERLRQDQRTSSAALSDEVLRRVRTLEQSRSRRAPSRVVALRWLPAAAVLALGVGGLALYHGVRRAPLAGPPRIAVELQLAAAKARSVAVAGDFNGWDAVTMQKGGDGVFRVRLALARGRYRYAFLLDGRTWVPDPGAATIVDSGYGGSDSVLDLTL
jgi:anti-sigma factor RsiW